MITRQTEQKSEVLKLAGFALLTPFGRICVEPLAVFKECEIVGFIGYLVFALIIGIFGLNCILRSCDILETKGIDKWKI